MVWLLCAHLRIRNQNKLEEAPSEDKSPSLQTGTGENVDVDLRRARERDRNLSTELRKTFFLAQDDIQYDAESRAVRTTKAVLAVLVELTAVLLSSVLAVCRDWKLLLEADDFFDSSLKVMKDAPVDTQEKAECLKTTLFALDDLASAKGKAEDDLDKGKKASDYFDDSGRHSALGLFHADKSKSTPQKVFGLEYLFTFFRPACLSAHVFPVTRKTADRGETAVRPVNPQREPPSSARRQVGDSEWPPETAHGLPWVTFRQELRRVGTFVGLPYTFPVSALRLAQTGFLRLTNGAIVCFFCGLRRDTWVAGESPQEVHRQLRPDCPVLTETDGDSQTLSAANPSGTLSGVMRAWSISGPLHREPPQASPDFRQPAPSARQAASSSSTLSGASPSASGTAGAEAAAGPSNQNGGQDSNRPRSQQPPRMGLLGGSAPDSRQGPAQEQRRPIHDGTAQPEPPRSEPQRAPSNEVRQTITYQQLGIVTELPKRPDMVQVSARLASFPEWPPNHSHTPSELAAAGFYYAGYSDCARCFFCGGGLKSWASSEDPLVEHARWFPKCPYVRQCQGQDFVDIVQQLNDEGDRPQISLAMVNEEISRRRAVGDHIQEPVQDAAIASVLEVGFSQDAVNTAVQRLQRDGHSLTADKLLDYLLEAEGRPSLVGGGRDIEATPDIQEDLEQITELMRENSEIRQQRLCKICLDKEASVIFLPCGHLACCTDCGPALRSCALCRQAVRGRIRAFPA